MSSTGAGEPRASAPTLTTICDLHHSQVRIPEFLIPVVIDSASLHQPGGDEGQGRRDQQLRVELHQLGKQLGRLLGLVQVQHHWIEHGPTLFLSVNPAPQPADARLSEAALLS